MRSAYDAGASAGEPGALGDATIALTMLLKRSSCIAASMIAGALLGPGTATVSVQQGAAERAARLQAGRNRCAPACSARPPAAQAEAGDHRDGASGTGARFTEIWQQGAAAPDDVLDYALAVESRIRRSDAHRTERTGDVADLCVNALGRCR
jgi:hypothetical protein